MMEWESGPIYIYSDPEAFGNGGVIASLMFPHNGKNRASAVVLVGTNDRAQAERWRSLFAAGLRPDLKADPPIKREPSAAVLAELHAFARQEARKGS